MLLTKSINEIHASSGITRVEWQVLNSVREKNPVNRVELAALIGPFADEASLDAILEKFKEQDILKEENDGLMLTSAGIQLHTTSLEKQSAFRQKAMANIPESAYHTTIVTLQKIIENISG